MNTRAKGNRAEREVVQYLRALGYKVIHVKGGGKYSGAIDFFAAENGGYGFDIIAKKSGEERLIQVKHRPVSPKHYMDFVHETLCRHGTAEIWVRQKGKRQFKTTIIKNKTGGPVVEKGVIDL